MGLRKILRSRWVKVPLLLIVLLLLAAGTYLFYKLATNTPAMYNAAGLAQPVMAGADENSDHLVYTSLRPSNWDIYLFDSLDADPRRLTEDPNLDYNPVLSHDGRWVVFVSERDGNANLRDRSDRQSRADPAYVLFRNGRCANTFAGWNEAGFCEHTQREPGHFHHAVRAW